MIWNKIKTTSKGHIIDYLEIVPPCKKELLLQIKSNTNGIPDKICVGYLKRYEGSKGLDVFIVPGANGEIKKWCDCLPNKFHYPDDMND